MSNYTIFTKSSEVRQTVKTRVLINADLHYDNATEHLTYQSTNAHGPIKIMYNATVIKMNEPKWCKLRAMQVCMIQFVHIMCIQDCVLVYSVRQYNTCCIRTESCTHIHEFT